MVTAPASTGITAISRYAVISQVHTNSGRRSSVRAGARMFMMVTMTLMAPRIEEAPIRWMEKISIGKEAPGCSTSGRLDHGPAAGAAYRGVLPNTDLLDPSNRRLLDSRLH